MLRRIGRPFVAIRCLATDSKAWPAEKLRNVAIIAHVDHGKTTLVDALLRQSLASAAVLLPDTERIMDCNDLEKERGITILAKATSIEYDGHRINIVDTPGHADFGGEVERIVKMVDGCLLVVDATEGPKAQTKFVLSKALLNRLLPIVVINKVDRDTARTEEVECEILDLFLSLNATDQQLQYSTVYASAKEGWSSDVIEKERGRNASKGMSHLFKKIIEEIPSPQVKRDSPFSMLVNSVESNQWLGKCCMGKVETGTVRIGDVVNTLEPNESRVVSSGRITRLFLRRGLEQLPILEAAAGEIVTVSGVDAAVVNSTVCNPSVTHALPINRVDPPTLSVVFKANLSPIAGEDGRAVSIDYLAERLEREAANNVALIVKKPCGDGVEVFGRGEMQLGILMETMRREGLEFSVTCPRVVYKTGANGEQLEPIEEVLVDVETEHAGCVIEKINKRRGVLQKMSDLSGNRSRLTFLCPGRGLIGYAHEFRNDTRGTGTLTHSFHSYEAFKGDLEIPRRGSLVSRTEGKATAFALLELEERGRMFISPGQVVYSGMVVGESDRTHDILVSPTREKVLSNIRHANKEEFVRLKAARSMELEELLAYMAVDEILELTPKCTRIAKIPPEHKFGKKKNQEKFV